MGRALNDRAETLAMKPERHLGRRLLAAFFGVVIALTGALASGAADAGTKTIKRKEKKTFVHTETAIANKFQAVIDTFKAQQGLNIASAIRHHEVSGISAALVDGDLPIEHRIWGFQNKNEEVRTSKSTIYHSASITKFVSSLGFATAHVRGDTNIYRNAQRFAKNFPDSLVAEWVNATFKKETADYPSKITIRRMLSHTAGLGPHSVATFEPDHRCNDLEAYILGKKTLLVPASDCPGVEPIHPPGTVFDYSGGGYAIAESMLATETGKSFAAYMNALLKEWGMVYSTFNDASAKMENLADGCSRGKCKSDEVRSSKIKAAGALLGNAGDYAKLLQLVVNDGKDREGRRVIEERALEIVFTPQHHLLSSMKACGGPGHCEKVVFTSSTGCPGGVTPCPLLRQPECLLNKCRLPITLYDDTEPSWDWDDNWYGQGVYLRHKLHDGLPRQAWHDGGSGTTNMATGFLLRRDKRVALVVFVNGETNWKPKGKNETERGAGLLRNAIIDAFRETYGLD